MVGFAYVLLIPTLIRPGRWARLASMAVAEDRRRRGPGSQLLAEAEAFARAAGPESIELMSGNQRVDAHAFYASRGYAETVTSTWMAKALTP
ncbi:MAG TPA: GNAT family N-acetyltransferase [Acidimicrobiales bacterium]|nr:GNAT family N-acetyltransferase [Acidimicrobiales bacterium]